MSTETRPRGRAPGPVAETEAAGIAEDLRESYFPGLRATAGRARLARLLGVDPRAVRGWVNEGRTPLPTTMRRLRRLHARRCQQ